MIYRKPETYSLVEAYQMLEHGAQHGHVAHQVQLVESFFERPWLMSEHAGRRAAAIIRDAPDYIFERAYVENVLGLDAPLLESGAWPRAFEKRIIQEHLIMEGFFSDLLQRGIEKGKEMLISAKEGVKKFGSDLWEVAKGFYYAVKQGKATQLAKSIMVKSIKKILMPIKKAIKWLKENLPKLNMPTFSKAVEKAGDVLDGIVKKMLGAKGWQAVTITAGAAVGLNWLWGKIQNDVQDFLGLTDDAGPVTEGNESAEGESKIDKIKAWLKEKGEGMLQGLIGGELLKRIGALAKASAVGPFFEAVMGAKKIGGLVIDALGDATKAFVKDAEREERDREETEKEKAKVKSNIRDQQRQREKNEVRRRLRTIIKEALEAASARGNIQRNYR